MSPGIVTSWEDVPASWCHTCDIHLAHVSRRGCASWSEAVPYARGGPLPHSPDGVVQYAEGMRSPMAMVETRRTPVGNVQVRILSPSRGWRSCHRRSCEQPGPLCSVGSFVFNELSHDRPPLGSAGHE